MIYGFLQIPSFISNAPGGVNPIGEISQLGMTYTRDMQYYSEPHANLLLFGTDPALTTDQQAHATVAHASAAYALNGIPNYNTSSGSLLNNIVVALGNGVSNVAIGPGVLNPVDNNQYPAWISFTKTTLGIDYNYKVWLSDAAFLADYPLGYFQFITPFDNLMELYTNFTTSNTLVSGMRYSDMMSRASAAVAGVAITRFDEMTLRVFSPTDQTQYFDLPIIVACNGGNIWNTQGAFLSAFKNLLLSLSSHTLSDWLAIIPSLIPTNKYYIVPAWSNIAINNVTVLNESKILSPTLPLIDVTGIHTQYFADYANADFNTYLNYTSMMYKSAGLFILPASGNLDGRTTWAVKFQDYFLVPLTDINVVQMSAETRRVAALLDEMVRLADTYVPTNVLPAGVTKEVRGTHNYLVKTVDTTMLAVLTRESA